MMIDEKILITGDGVPQAVRTEATHSINLRTIQTLLSDDELARQGLTILEPSKSSITRTIFGRKIPWHSNMPIMATVLRYNGMAIDDLVDQHLTDLLPNACFNRRVAELREIAQDEGLALSEASLDHAEQFLSGLRNASLPSVFLVGNGNFRLVWDRNGERVGLQFLEDGRVQFVFLQKLNGQISSLMGLRPSSHIFHLIDQNGLHPIMKL